MKILISLFVCIVAPALARDKTDVLIMKNGDRITCEVKRLEGGILETSLDYVDGNISVDWLKVERLESKAMFLVQLQDGSAFSGRVVTPKTLAGAVAKLEVQEIDSQEPVTVDQADVVRMSQTSQTFLQRLNGGLTLGSLYSKGNSTTQYNVSSDVGYQETRWATKLQYNSNLSSSTGADPATRNQADLSAYRLLPRKNYFYAGAAGFLQSSEQGIRQRLTLGGTLGVFLKNTNQARFALLAGPGWQRTLYVPSAEDQRTENIAVLLVGSSLEVFRFKKTRLNASASLAPALTESGRVFLKTNVAYYLKLFGKVDWNISAYGNWDNRPPDQLSGSDYGSSIGFSWSFGNH